ncbi:hypothetical protein N7461_008196 [Penicillium sp. DV-2018c]|nr:hypothetical protein N7461_008196 [Penicillium sp. DV-2018c]
MRLSAALYNPDHPWLACLKSAQLQRIARATGIQSSGTKSALVDRIAAELTLQLQSQLPASGDAAVDTVAVSGSGTGTTLPQDPRVDPGLLTGTNARPGNESTVKSKSKSQDKSKLARVPTSNAKPWSILSIDMGIQNLAFAHLLVPRSKSEPNEVDVQPALELTAWHRLAVSEISTLALSSINGSGIEKTVIAEHAHGVIPEAVAAAEAEAEEGLDKSQVAKSNRNGKQKQKQKEKEKEKPSFSPDLYAANAYTLISSLLTAYRPTHILIERQRFRSGGGSAVQEWTLRVGVLEGMLYAVLHTLRHERGEYADVIVNGVEPKRVVRYWLEGALENGDICRKEKGEKRLTARDVKKAKIDIVGRWVSSAMEEPGVVSDKIVLAAKAASPVVHGVADAYLRKWQGRTVKKVKGKRKGTCASDPLSSLETGSSDSALDGEMVPLDIGKLDDLADCLLQGVTWLEWQVMRDRFAREGAAALDSIP